MGGGVIYISFWPCIHVIISSVIPHTKYEQRGMKMALPPAARIAHDGDQQVKHQEDDEEGEE